MPKKLIYDTQWATVYLTISHKRFEKIVNYYDFPSWYSNHYLKSVKLNKSCVPLHFTFKRKCHPVYA